MNSADLAGDPAQKMERLGNLDVLRALAALAVCFFHFSGTGFTPDSWVGEVFGFGYLGVDVFFVISGFIIPLSLFKASHEAVDGPRFILRRFLRLYPAYFCAGLLMIGLWYASSWLPGFRGQQPSFSPGLLFANATLTSGFLGYEWLIPVFWTLAIEVQYYLLLVLFYPWLAHRKKTVAVATLMVWLALAFVPWGSASAFSFCALFGMGIILFLHQRRILGSIAFMVFELTAFSIQLMCGGLASAVAGLFAVLFIAYARPIRIRWLSFVGVISYSLYLLHVPIGGRVMNLATRLTDAGALRIAAMLVALAVSVAVAWGFYRWIEYPSHKLSGRFNKRPSSRKPVPVSIDVLVSGEKPSSMP